MQEGYQFPRERMGNRKIIGIYLEKNISAAEENKPENYISW